MATCKDCVHYELCKKYNNVYERELSERYCTECPHFKNKANVIELPCKVGGKVYTIRKDTKVIYRCVVCEFIFQKHYDEVEKKCKVYNLDDNRITYYDFSAFGTDVFFTYEEAEQALKEGA